jgi:hypothetical protein
MASPPVPADGSPATVPGCTYHCLNCDKNDVKLLLCARCKIARYCSRDCQIADRSNHRGGCIDPASDGPWRSDKYKKAVDPLDPSNPLYLRSRPVIAADLRQRLASTVDTTKDVDTVVKNSLQEIMADDVLL